LFLNNVYKRIGKFLSTIITFFVVMIGWVFFRIEHLPDALTYLTRMFSFDFKTGLLPDPEFITFFVIAVFFAFFAWFRKGQIIQDAIYFGNYSNSRHLIVSAATLVLFVFALSSITAFGFNPFIYFRF